VPTRQLGERWRVLIVEDNVEAAESLAFLLRIDGYNVRIASDGPMALQAAEAEQPDIVLLDIGLPRLDGYEVAKRLRQVKTAARPVVIAVTGYGEREQSLRSYESGIDLHLTKPVDIKELRQFLERYQSVAKHRP
jgi:two-component system CheB/CheR fusion protein